MTFDPWPTYRYEGKNDGKYGELLEVLLVLIVHNNNFLTSFC